MFILSDPTMPPSESPTHAPTTQFRIDVTIRLTGDQIRTLVDFMTVVAASGVAEDFFSNNTNIDNFRAALSLSLNVTEHQIVIRKRIRARRLTNSLRIEAVVNADTQTEAKSIHSTASGSSFAEEFRQNVRAYFGQSVIVGNILIDVHGL